jgi:hypothetical protein
MIKKQCSKCRYYFAAPKTAGNSDVTCGNAT